MNHILMNNLQFLDRIVIGSGGKIAKTEQTPPCDEMDVWTHRYYDAGGIPASNDRVFDLPVGFKWNAGLPMNFDNPLRAANRYSSTRAMVMLVCGMVHCVRSSRSIWAASGTLRNGGIWMRLKTSSSRIAVSRPTSLRWPGGISLRSRQRTAR